MSISEVLDTLHKTACGSRTSVDDVLNAFGRRTYGPILFVIGLVSLSPVGAIPGASILFGSLIVILMAQYIVRDAAPWVPGWIRRRSVPSDKAQAAVDKLNPYVERIERVVHPRWHALTIPPWTYVAALICIGLALTMYPLALVPWGVMPPSFAIAVLGLGMISGDGLLIAIGIAASVAALAAAIWLIPFGFFF